MDPAALTALCSIGLLWALLFLMLWCAQPKQSEFTPIHPDMAAVLLKILEVKTP